MEWKQITIFNDLIKAESEKSYKIVFPHKSSFNGYCVWLSKNLVKSDSNTSTILYANEFTFKIKKYGRGRFNQFEIIDEKTISADEFEIAFSKMENLQKKQENPYETHIPPKLEPKPVAILEELIDD